MNPLVRSLFHELADLPQSDAKSCGQTQRAIDIYQELLEKQMASHPDPENDLRHAPALSRIYEALARLHLRNGAPGPAGLNSALRLKIWQNWNRKLPASIFVQRELTAASSS